MWLFNWENPKIDVPIKNISIQSAEHGVLDIQSLAIGLRPLEALKYTTKGAVNVNAIGQPFHNGKPIDTEGTTPTAGQAVVWKLGKNVVPGMYRIRMTGRTGAGGPNDSEALSWIFSVDGVGVATEVTPLPPVLEHIGPNDSWRDYTGKVQSSDLVFLAPGKEIAISTDRNWMHLNALELFLAYQVDVNPRITLPLRKAYLAGKPIRNNVPIISPKIDATLSWKMPATISAGEYYLSFPVRTGEMRSGDLVGCYTVHVRNQAVTMRLSRDKEEVVRHDAGKGKWKNITGWIESVKPIHLSPGSTVSISTGRANLFIGSLQLRKGNNE
jgi:hypothetical protein